MTLNAKLSAQVSADQSVTRDFAAVRFPLAVRTAVELTDGVGANQADLLWSDTRTLAPSATESLDLAGVLTDAVGNVLTFVKVKALYVAAAAANANNVLVGGAASNALVNWVGDATDVVRVRPGGVFLLVAPDAPAYAVTAATGDLLKVANSGGGTSVTYDIVIIGTSA